ncbi:peptidylprolyl isomerase [soil metagenome]
MALLSAVFALDGIMRILHPALLALPLSLLAAPGQGQAPPKGAAPAPLEIVAAAPASAWKAIDADDLLVMTLAGGERIIIQLTPIFSQAHVGNMRVLAKAHWWDATSVYRVQDNYVVQWGDRSETKPLPPGVTAPLPEDYFATRKALTPAITPLPSRDSYAAETGFLDGWPVAMDRDHVWLPHCYGMVGAGRNLSPDAGNGAELYAVIGHAPRQLDRNIALVGRVIEGIDNLSSLPRGTGEIGFYEKDQAPTPIVSIRLASALPQAERPRFEMMDTTSRAFADYAAARTNRRDPFFNLPAGGADLCNIPVPVRTIR